MGIRYNGHNINLNTIKLVRYNGHTIYNKTAVIYTITTNVSNGTYSGSTSIVSGASARVVIAANSGYELPETISVSNCSYQYNSTTGEIILSNPTGDVVISATCIQVYEGLCFTCVEDGSIGYSITGTLTTIHIQKSSDGITWTDWDGNQTILQAGSKLYVRNLENTLSTIESNYFKFVMSGKFRASGNVNSMINFSSLSPHCFKSMFQSCVSLISAPSLPATALADYCYYYMFSGCVSLISAPSLPATALADYCYYSMFQGCISLISAPSLPATALADSCYQFMFNGCTSLISAPSLPATALVDYCYSSMFNGCTSLISAPSLPATALVKACYYSMFQGCTSLISAPSLPATALANYCYNSMFNNCIHLKVKENDGTGGTLIFTCPDISGINSPTDNMFNNTGGTFTGTPSSGNSYYYYDNTNKNKKTNLTSRSLIKQFKKII